MEICTQQKLSISLSICWLFLLPLHSIGQSANRLIPDAVIVQHAGSIGFISAGAGYEIFKNKRGNIDLLYGYVPQSKGGRLDILTAKFAYRPFEIKISDVAVIHPLNPGVFFSYTIDKKLSFSWDRSQYGKSYYGWSEALRSHLSVSNEVELSPKKWLDNKKIKAISFYSEFNAIDLYLISWVLNTEAIPVTDIFKLGIGVRVYL